MQHRTSSALETARQAASVAPNATDNLVASQNFETARDFDPHDPPRFSEWVRVNNFVEEDDRPTQGRHVVIKKRRRKLTLVLAAAIFVVLAAMLLFLSRRNSAPELPANPVPRKTAKPRATPKATPKPSPKPTIKPTAASVTNNAAPLP